jgi:hypothetical protein
MSVSNGARHFGMFRPVQGRTGWLVEDFRTGKRYGDRNGGEMTLERAERLARFLHSQEQQITGDSGLTIIADVEPDLYPERRTRQSPGGPLAWFIGLVIGLAIVFALISIFIVRWNTAQPRPDEGILKFEPPDWLKDGIGWSVRTYLILAVIVVPIIVPVAFARRRCLSVGRWALFALFFVLTSGFFFILGIGMSFGDADPVAITFIACAWSMLLFAACGCLLAAVFYPKETRG